MVIRNTRAGIGCPRSWEGTDKLLKFPVIGLITVALGDGMLLTDCASAPLQPHGQPPVRASCDDTKWAFTSG